MKASPKIRISPKGDTVKSDHWDAPFLYVACICIDCTKGVPCLSCMIFNVKPYEADMGFAS